MRHDPKTYLWDMQEAVEAVLDFISGKSFEDYEQQRMLRSAVERELMMIGEATKRLVRHDEQLADKISNYRKIISLGNIIAHKYYEINNDLIWTTVNNDLPGLHAEVSDMLEHGRGCEHR